jgi:hypothetical protein
LQVIREEGARFFDHNRAPFEEVSLWYRPEHDVQGPQKTVTVNPRVLDYETLIALNQLKVHETATVTLGLKNIAMSFPAADHYGHPRWREKHDHGFFEDLHSFIAALALRAPGAAHPADNPDTAAPGCAKRGRSSPALHRVRATVSATFAVDPCMLPQATSTFGFSPGRPQRDSAVRGFPAAA